MAVKVLIIEDEVLILNGISDALGLHGFEVESATAGDEGLRKARERRHDLIILDIMLPKIDGLHICELLRAEGNTVPIVMLTAKGEEESRVKGLRIGADDYISKPFSVKELVARVQAQLRRRNFDLADARADEAGEGGVLSFSGLTLDLGKRTCHRGPNPIVLTAREFKVLECLIRCRGRVVSRAELLKEAWGYVTEGIETRTVDVTLGKLRQKIEPDPDDPEIIVTVRGGGYRFGGRLDR